jgi:hypothetical protein
MTLNEIVYNLADITGKTDVPHFLERLKFNVMYYRALLIRRDQERNTHLPEQFMQSFCMEMEKVNASECCDVEIDCIIMRSKKKLPSPIRLKNGSPLTYVGTLDNLKSYAPMSVGELPFIGHSTFTGKVARYFVQNDYLYIVNAKPIKVVVKGIFEDPRDLKDFDCDGDCYDDDNSFPITADMVQRITQSLLAGELQILLPGDGGEVKVNE